MQEDDKDQYKWSIFCSTNEDEFLDDATGERRWLPVRVGQCEPEEIARDCLQLWAEARDAWQRSGIDWQPAEQLARAEHAGYKISDPWTPMIEQWLETPDDFAEDRAKPGTRKYLQISEIAQGALHLDARSTGKREEMRIARILCTLGYTRTLQRRDGKPRKVWIPPV